MSKINNIEDLVIIGSGPAGYAAALKSKKIKPVLFEGTIIHGISAGGQLTTTTNVDNYPTFSEGIQGPDLMDLIREQAVQEGVRIVPRNVKFVKKCTDSNLIEVDAGKRKIKAKSLIIATGSRARRIYVKGTNNEELWQKGISACAVCDGKIFEGKTVGVIGGGDTAMEEVLFLSNIAKKVLLFHRREEFRARKDTVNKIKQIENVEFVLNKVLKEAKGEKTLESVIMTDTKNGEELEYKLDGLFFAIGHDPNTFFFDEKFVKLHESKYIVVSKNCTTTIKGVFGAGDVIDSEYRQAITAARSGALAAIEAMDYLKEEYFKKEEKKRIKK